jgi:ADP-heptose:LPS heptosyltransferase
MDSANMHLASLMGTRCISIWGSTHPYAGFLGFGQSEDDVVQVEDLTCRPCSVFGDKECYRGDWACLEELDIQKIVEKFDQMKLSVCIPVYNFDVRELVFDLKKKLKIII